jgi:outer membrane immunogenic protein
MKRILFTAVSLGVLGLVSPALGADLPVYTKAPAIATPLYDWSGFYVGVFGGGGYGNHNLNNALGPAGFANFTVNYSSKGGLALQLPFCFEVRTPSDRLVSSAPE